VNSLIYIPPQTTRVMIDLKFPWQGKEYKVKEITIKDYKNLIRNAKKKGDEKK